jgi:hypothetical protein
MGTMTFRNGDSLTGYWNGILGLSQGTYSYNKSSQFESYEGQIEDLEWNGKGRLTFRNGTIFEGRFEFGLLHGEGSMFFPDGAILRGVWENGFAPKNGTIVYDNNSTYATFVGEIGKGHEWLSGKLILKDGCTYEGSFKNGLMHGAGTLTFSNVTSDHEIVKFVGNFLQNEPSGSGTVYWRNKDKCSVSDGNNFCDGMILNVNGLPTNRSSKWSYSHFKHAALKSKNVYNESRLMLKRTM